MKPLGKDDAEVFADGEQWWGWWSWRKVEDGEDKVDDEDKEAEDGQVVKKGDKDGYRRVAMGDEAGKEWRRWRRWGCWWRLWRW